MSVDLAVQPVISSQFVSAETAAVVTADAGQDDQPPADWASGPLTPGPIASDDDKTTTTTDDDDDDEEDDAFENEPAEEVDDGFNDGLDEDDDLDDFDDIDEDDFDDDFDDDFEEELNDDYEIEIDDEISDEFGLSTGKSDGSAKEQLLATLNPKLDYRGVLRNFRQSVLAVRRRLTRMKPSRRYGFAQMGSRYDFTTKLLFAVDVSGSMGSRDLQLGFSVVSRFFRYGVESVDVIWFDEDLRCEPLTLRRARTAFEVTGRGGTNFKPVVDYIDKNRDYDGLIIFTDGYAPVPPNPKNTRTRILWLFKDEATYQQMNTSLRPLGRSAFLKESPR